ncbi:hypothetical protein EDF35_0083 [Rathayibacter sp. PhB151]|uniref:hypothetical protein n=1 Tax=Rathayibacter sp. PhB151 TaxID=2485189 RepID=UPI001062579A|nr:hypothetical protein [Rathayibacter sp. PhB151]TDX82041.1 hypothetical protein EDF35_0083 [Rathayibacter sp. PhB151]
MVCEFPVWVHLARKTPVRAAVRGRVYEIGAPERPDGEVLLTVWTGGRAVGQVLATEPPVFRRLGPRADPEPQPVSGIPDLLKCAAGLRSSVGE